jgi:hypothetical protein
MDSFPVQGLVDNHEHGRVKTLKNHNSLWAAKLNQLQRHSEMNNSSGTAFAAVMVNIGHEVAEGQWLYFGTDFAVRDWLNFHNANILHSCEQAACHAQI